MKPVIVQFYPRIIIKELSLKLLQFSPFVLSILPINQKETSAYIFPTSTKTDNIHVA